MPKHVKHSNEKKLKKNYCVEAAIILAEKLWKMSKMELGEIEKLHVHYVNSIYKVTV